MTWHNNWREKIWLQLSNEWDLLIIGGGITGAGILRQAVSMGLKALLVEQYDFAWGTSSRSSKMVHGGLRYLKEGKIKLVAESVTERETMLKNAPGLVDPLPFLMPVYKGQSPGKFMLGGALTFYDAIARRPNHRYLSEPEFELMAPRLKTHGLKGGYQYADAQTDDARLVLRLLKEAVASGGEALNYAGVTDFLRESGQVCGVKLRDNLDGKETEVRAKAVVSATGVWADSLREKLGRPHHLRPLRGSHLVFSRQRFPVEQVIATNHPRDGRYVFIYPWETVTVVGTTDLDHETGLEQEPAISMEEVDYLLEVANALYPGLSLGREDIVSTWAGVRPVISENKQKDPSKESRDYAIWQEDGLLTVTGGKLTTYRPTALKVLETLKPLFPHLSWRVKIPVSFRPVGQSFAGSEKLSREIRQRITGRYGTDSARLVEAAQDGELEIIPGTPYLWAELRWAARAEAVAHLDDLLLRRVRLGLLLTEGGKALLPEIERICREELGWSKERWNSEEQRYLELWHKNYYLPHI